MAGASVIAGAAVIAALHVLPASSHLDPMSEPLSQYAFTPNAWMFDFGVTALALGLTVLVSALVLGSCLSSRSPACAVLTACSVGLVVVVVFPEHDAHGAVATGGRIHWAAAMLTFGGLSVVPMLLGRHRTPGCSQLTSLARRLSIVTTPCFVLVLLGSLVRYGTTLPVPRWWFGLGERALVAAEFAIAGVLTRWAWRGCACGSADGMTALRIATAKDLDEQRSTRLVA